MSVSYRINSDMQLVIVEVTGRFTLHQGVAATERFANDARADYSYDFLVDCGANPHFDLDFARMLTMISRFAPFHRKRSANSLSVCYAPGDVAFGMARMYHTLVADKVTYRMALARTRLETAQLLDRPVEQLFRVWPEAG
ncbi:hypothetical protein [Cognatishimia sp. F0-27]|uniref:hypothetical protein n=1 Tax=Cognatishimia sp. F0-27 TaxID=2816855 RepID=UPI001D0C7AB0|nr:hypothetical protein [Cognatishimia sp. F0-27]MCC1493363.1 hypothetical protein [Cognatishimia sp. F0-27]